MNYFESRIKTWLPILGLLIISFWSLFISFNSNFFGVANQHWFAYHQFDSEALVIGRLVKSSTDGLLSDGSRLGRYTGLPGDVNEAQTALYSKHISGEIVGGWWWMVGLQLTIWTSRIII